MRETYHRALDLHPEGRRVEVHLEIADLRALKEETGSALPQGGTTIIRLSMPLGERF